MQTGLHRHPFLWFLLPLALGIVCREYTTLSFSPTTTIAILIALVLWMCLCYRRFSRCFLAAFMALLFVVGMSSLSLHYRSLTFPFINDKQVCLIKISDNAEEKQRSVQYKAEILAYQQGDSLIALPHHPTCLLYFPKDSISYTLQRGEQLAINARMQPPQNFGDIGFDYARYLKRKGIAATAYVPMNSWKLIGKDTLIGWREKADRYREKIAAYYHRLGFSGDELGVLTALTIGEKEELSEEIRETYSVAGASHVLALSGLHVGLLAWLLMVCFSLFIRYWPALRPLLVLVTLCLLGGFAYFTGLSPSVVRAVIMFSLLAIVRLWRNEPLTLNVVAFTAFIMLCFKPIWLFDVGFQLSFSAVFAILLFFPRLNALCPSRSFIIKKVWSLMAVSIAAQLGTAPLVIYYFGRFSTHFLLTNLWIIPLVTLVMYLTVALLLLAPFPMLHSWVALALQKLLMVQHKGLHWIESLPYASFDNIAIGWVDVLLLYLLLHAIYLYIQGFSLSRLRWLCVIGIVVAVFVFIG